MHITEYLEGRSRPLISLEILPPERGQTIEELCAAIETLMPFHPTFINVTYHQQQLVSQRTSQGPRTMLQTKRPGTVGICAAIANRYRLETVPHLLCGGFNAVDTEDALIDLHYLGFRNLFVVRGDPPPGETLFQPTPGGHRYAAGLVEQISQLNRGIYLEELLHATPTEFCMGVAGYPEGHYQSTSREDDMLRLLEKVEKGARYVITQMVFSSALFADFRRRAREVGITVPIIPGIKVLTRPRQLASIPRTFHVSLPQELLAWSGETDPPRFARAAVEQATRLCRELLALEVPGLHFFTMGRGAEVASVLAALREEGDLS
ncbi:MAG: methylenetetrahydrofolate reductase [Coprothermobacterota bacterium]|nr:methylenetetrahydrofolate reductase [Coprothermobacterota bacterium]